MSYSFQTKNSFASILIGSQRKCKLICSFSQFLCVIVLILICDLFGYLKCELLYTFHIFAFVAQAQNIRFGTNPIGWTSRHSKRHSNTGTVPETNRYVSTTFQPSERFQIVVYVGCLKLCCIVIHFSNDISLFAVFKGKNGLAHA